jgi:YhcH/YjgK/YiaL family protein
MVVDKIENRKRYANLNERIGKALEYIAKTNFLPLEAGRYEVDSDDIFALVQEYDTREPDACKLEGHFRYIDIQYMIRGSELMGVTPLTNQAVVEKNETDDYAFYSGDSLPIRVDEGMFTIFFPHDLHKPRIKLGEVSKVKKVVVKVRV